MGNFFEFAFKAVDAWTAVQSIELNVSCSYGGDDKVVVDG